MPLTAPPTLSLLLWLAQAPVPAAAPAPSAAPDSLLTLLFGRESCVAVGEWCGSAQVAYGVRPEGYLQAAAAGAPAPRDEEDDLRPLTPRRLAAELPACALAGQRAQAQEIAGRFQDLPAGAAQPARAIVDEGGKLIGLESTAANLPRDRLMPLGGFVRGFSARRAPTRTLASSEAGAPGAPWWRVLIWETATEYAFVALSPLDPAAERSPLRVTRAVYARAGVARVLAETLRACGAVEPASPGAGAGAAEPAPAGTAAAAAIEGWSIDAHTRVAGYGAEARQALRDKGRALQRGAPDAAIALPFDPPSARAEALGGVGVALGVVVERRGPFSVIESSGARWLASVGAVAPGTVVAVRGALSRIATVEAGAPALLPFLRGPSVPPLPIWFARERSYAEEGPPSCVHE